MTSVTAGMKHMQPHVAPALVVCSDAATRQRMANDLSQCGLHPVVSPSVRDAQAILTQQCFSLVLCEADLPDGSFLEVLGAARQRVAGVPVVIASRKDDWDEYLKAMRLGAFDYIPYPCAQRELDWVVHRALWQAAALR